MCEFRDSDSIEITVGLNECKVPMKNRVDEGEQRERKTEKCQREREREAGLGWAVLSFEAAQETGARSFIFPWDELQGLRVNENCEFASGRGPGSGIKGQGGEAEKRLWRQGEERDKLTTGAMLASHSGKMAQSRRKLVKLTRIGW